MLLPNSINIVKEQNDNVTIHIDNAKSFNLLSESYLTKQINSVTVRGKGGEVLYEFFYTEVNTVTRKDGTIISVTDNDILFDEFNLFFFFISSEGGEGPTTTDLPIGNFVFVNPLGNDVTAERENFHKPFLTLNAAKNAAASGDTIYVYGGTYIEFQPLHKDGVKWNFTGKPVVNFAGSRCFSDDLTGQTEISVKGDAIFNHIGIGQFVNIQFDSIINFECYSITALGQQIFWLGTGTGIINVLTKIEVTLVNRCIQLESNARYLINIDDIFCNSLIGGVSNAINLRSTFVGDTIINARRIRLERAFGSTLTTSPNVSGKLTLNVSDKISFDHATPTLIQANQAITHLSGLLIINGNIDGGKGIAIDIQTQFPTVAPFLKTLEHNGEAYNDGTQPVIFYGADAGFWAAGKSTLKLNGKYSTSNDKTICQGGTAGNKLTVKGRVENQSQSVATAGVFIEETGTVIFEDCVIIMDNSVGLRECISSNIPQNIKLFTSLGSNKNASANITNLIAANNLTVDAEYE